MLEKKGVTAWLRLFCNTIISHHFCIRKGERKLRMKMIVGLGNPGTKYEQTRHNIGFSIIDHLAEQLMIQLDKQKFKSVYGFRTLEGEKVMLCKPITFMNLSGEAVRPLLDYYKVEIENLLVIYDDLDLPTGRLRLRQKGGTGGHNGVKSIIQHLGTEHFKRLRIGIGRPDPHQTVLDHVLKPFHQSEQPLVQEAILHASQACEEWLRTPFLEVMNRFNSFR